MKAIFNQNNNQFVFSWKERITLLIKGKLILDDLALRHLGNFLMKMYVDWLEKQPEHIKQTVSSVDTEIKTK